MSEPVLLGIDIGGTKTAVAAVTHGGTAIALRSAPSGRGGPQVVDVAVRVAGEVVDSVGGLGRVTAIGTCMPGFVNPRTGRARHAVNLGVESLDLAGELGRALGRPVEVENDVKAAALGAHHLRPRGWGLAAVPIPAHRAGEDTGGTGGTGTPDGTAYGRGGASSSGDEQVDTLAYLNVGTGLAAATVRDGVLVRGIDGAAGEIGHVPVGGDVLCPCGQVGCLETVASGSALSRLWPASQGGGRNPFDAALAGDAAAVAAVDVVCHGIGLAIQMLVLASGAEHVVIGGGLIAYGDALVDGIRADLRRRGSTSPMIEALELGRRFELMPASVPVAAIGAALLPGRSPEPFLLTDGMAG